MATEPENPWLALIVLVALLGLYLAVGLSGLQRPNIVFCEFEKGVQVCGPGEELK